MNDSTGIFAERLALVAARLDAAGNDREATADFLLRCAFTSFATSLDLLPPRAFGWAIDGGQLPTMWAAMLLVHGIPRRGIFENPVAPTLDDETKAALRDLADVDCAKVELSVFGSLVERALNDRARHSLGAHYTPREYVERLVRPTIEEPLRSEWEIVGGLSRLTREGRAPHHTPAQSLAWLLEFHSKLCRTRVLDPACGSGNFLYVAMDIMQDLEDEVVAEIELRGAERPAECITPAQFLGIEINQRAAGIADLVLQLGYLRRRHLRQ